MIYPKITRWLLLIDFEIMATPQINFNTPKKVTSPVTREIQKLRRER